MNETSRQCWISRTAILSMACCLLVAISAILWRHSEAPLGHSSPTSAPEIATQKRVLADYGKLPMPFEPNRGQTAAPVQYLTRGRGYTLFLTGTEAVWSLRAPGGQSKAHSRNSGPGSVLRMQMVKANPSPSIEPQESLAGRSNYLKGNNPSAWVTEVPQFAQIRYHDVYPGIDLAYHGANGRLEFDYLVAAGAQPGSIALRFEGARALTTNPAGDLILKTKSGDLTLQRPVAYQANDQTRNAVEARFVTSGNQVRVALGPYDHSRELVIDPTVTYATFLGGSGEDDGFGIAADSSGNAYVTGETDSTDFPVAGTPFQTNNFGSLDIFVSKLAAGGASLVYSTYIGGSGDESGNGIAVDSSGNAFIAGGTDSSDFPVTGAFPKPPNIALDAFVLKLNASGSSLTYSDKFGGSGTDVAIGVAVDSTGNAYVAGVTQSDDFPLQNPIQSTPGGLSNGFLSKFTADGSQFTYSTYIGGSNGDFSSGVAADGSGNAYVTGGTLSPTFPVTSGAFQTSCGNCDGTSSDAYVTVLNSSGSNYIYSTYLGGTGADEGHSIKVDSSGNAYLTGLTKSTDFPLLSAAQSTYGGGIQDAFVTKFNSAGSALVYSTYLGGEASDTGTSLAIDSANDAFVTGQTSSTAFPLANPTQAAIGGGIDAFVTELNSSGSQFAFSTYLGGSADENSLAAGGTAGAIAVDASGNMFLTGNTASSDFPTHSPFQSSFAGGTTDAFVAEISASTSTVGFTLSADPSSVSVTAGNSVPTTITVAPTGGFTGTVTLSCSSGLPSGATCSFDPTSVTTSGTSTLTISTSSSTPSGSYVITVLGTSGATTGTTVVNLSVSGGTAGFSITPSPSSISVVAGNSGTSTITVASSGGFTGTVSLSCSGGLPSGTSCSFNPTSVDTSGTSILTISTTARSAGLQMPRGIYYATWLPMGGIALIGAGLGTRRKRRMAVLLGSVLLVGIALTTGCGGGNNNNNNGGSGTPAGTYTVTLAGSSGGTTNNAAITLTVQ